LKVKQTLNVYKRSENFNFLNVQIIYTFQRLLNV